MHQPGSRLRSSLAALAVSASLLASCGHGSSGSGPVVPSGGGGGGTNIASVGSATATFAFSFPKPTTSSAKRASLGTRAPKYLSSATKSVTIQVTDTQSAAAGNADIYANVPAALKLVQVANFANLTGNPDTPGQCGTDPNNAGNYKCTATFQMPIGIDTTAITSWDTNGGTGNILSKQVASLTVVQGVTNSFGVSLDANAASMTIGATSGFCSGSFNVAASQNVGTVGTSAVTFTVTYKDLAGKTIVAPGLPTIKVNGSSTSGTITGTGGNVNFSITQAAQSYTLAATTSATTAAITVTATPPNAGDGLSFSKTLSYTFSSGPAPPASFLAVVEQPNSGSGQINLYTVTLGASDSFTPYTTATLAAEPPPGPANSDVDYPQDLLFDANGDLLIANGGSGNPDFGNFACVPAGSIATGANNATIITTGMDDPAFLALNSDNSVAVGNNTANAVPLVEDFLLSGTYTPAPNADDVFESSYSGTVGDTSVISLPVIGPNPAGSYASAITDGATSPTNTRIVVTRPGMSTLNITNGNLADPVLAYDPANHQIVAGDGNTPGGIAANAFYISFFDATTDSSTPVQQFVFDEDACYAGGSTPYAGCPPNTNSTPGNSDMKLSLISASSSGYIAIGGITASGLPEVWVLDNTSGSRKLVFGPIPYDATTTSGGATFVYGSNAIVTAIRWLTGTKLLVSLESTNNTARQGLYTYDVTQSGSDCNNSGNPCYDFNGTAFPNGPKQTGFLNLTSKSPLSAAYKP